MQNAIELILLKQWAGYLAIPVWIMSAEGDLLFYNEPAEEVLGVRFDEAGELHADDLAERFEVTSLEGDPLPNEELPIVVALTKHEPRHKAFRIRGFDGIWRDVAVTAFPVEGGADRILGAVAMFWEIGKR